jgi:hypothetical protein
MIGASIETTRELWASSLREVKKRIRPLFTQERTGLAVQVVLRASRLVSSPRFSSSGRPSRC